MGQENEKIEENLYRIGMFSKMNQITIKTLRYYDEVGLLHPRFIDPDNGYRYYTLSQLAPLHRIIALRNIGYSIEELIRIQDGESEQLILQRKKQQLLAEIAERMTMLSQIEGYIQQEETNYHMIVRQLPEVIVASTRTTISNHKAFFTIMPEMGMKMEKAGCICAIPEYCFTIYHDNEYKDEVIDVEICEAVTQMNESTDGLTFKIIAEVPEAICTMHKGPYQTLPNAYAAAMRFAEANGYEIIDAFRENYIDGVWNKESESDWLTEIQIPVKKAIL